MTATTSDAKLREQIRLDWAENVYYDEFDNAEGMAPFWAPDTVFRHCFEMLDLTHVAELACGHGRHAAHALTHYGAGVKTLALIDINETNIRACRARFAGDPRVSCFVTGGADLAVLKDESLTALFCYDAMVHFEFDDVFAYIREFARVMKPGGRVLIHHSNNDRQPGATCQEGVHWRNFMSAPLFAHAASRAGFNVMSQHVIDWVDAKALDCVSLLEKRPDAVGAAPRRSGGWLRDVLRGFTGRSGR